MIFCSRKLLLAWLDSFLSSFELWPYGLSLVLILLKLSYFGCSSLNVWILIGEEIIAFAGEEDPLPLGVKSYGFTASFFFAIGGEVLWAAEVRYISGGGLWSGETVLLLEFSRCCVCWLPSFWKSVSCEFSWMKLLRGLDSVTPVRAYLTASGELWEFSTWLFGVLNTLISFCWLWRWTSIFWWRSLGWLSSVVTGYRIWERCCPRLETDLTETLFEDRVGCPGAELSVRTWLLWSYSCVARGFKSRAVPYKLGDGAATSGSVFSVAAPPLLLVLFFVADWNGLFNSSSSDWTGLINGSSSSDRSMLIAGYTSNWTDASCFDGSSYTPAPPAFASAAPTEFFLSSICFLMEPLCCSDCYL